MTVGVYSSQMTHIIGEGAYDAESHRNERFLVATEIGPFPREMQHAWTKMRQEAIETTDWWREKIMRTGVGWDP